MGNIEDGAIAADGTIGLIVAMGTPGGQRAVVRRSPAGEFRVVFDSSNAPAGTDLRTLIRLRMARTGEMVFQAGSGLDSDRLFRANADSVDVLAGVEPGVIPPDFRVLGNVRIATGGTVGFVGGGHDCEITTRPGGAIRHTCRAGLFISEPGSDVFQVGDLEPAQVAELPINDLRVEASDDATIYFSISGSRSEPTVIRYRDGEATTLLAADTELDGLGIALGGPEGIAGNDSGEVLISGALPPPVIGAPRPVLLGILAGEHLTPVAVEGDTVDGLTVQRVRGIGLDSSGRAFYEAILVDPDAPNAPAVRSLRIANASSNREIIRERAPFPGEQKTVISISASRMNPAGEVVFVTSLGRVSDGTIAVEEIRATLRRTDGSLVTLVSSLESGQVGLISELTIFGFESAERILLLAERNQSSDRALLLADATQAR